MVFTLPYLQAQEPGEEMESTGSVTVEQPWIQLGEDEALMLPAYMRLVSDANQSWSLRKVTVKGFRAVMIHRMILQDGFPRMVLKNSLTVRAGETIVLNKEGYHLMFLGPRKKLRVNDEIKTVFHIQDRPPLEVTFKVYDRPPKIQAHRQP